jgi:acyl carrier protein
VSHVRADIIAWIAEALHGMKITGSAEKVGEETGLLGRGIGLDSVEALQLVVAAETKFDLTVDDSDLKPEHFRTVGSFATFLEQRLPQP